MRRILAILASITLFSAGAGAQTHLPVPTWGYGLTPWQPLSVIPSTPLTDHKWQLRPSVGLSAGYLFFNRGGMSYITAPLSLNLYHPLTPNVTAFAGVVAAPTVFSMGSLYAPSPLNQPFGSDFTRGLGINAGIQGGLIYTNDAHTFSISGSIFMERGSYPTYPSSRRNGDSKN